MYETAYQQFQTEYVTGKKTYHRFVNDFISYHLPFEAVTLDEWKQHSQNINVMYDLLANRKDLVLEYFGRTRLSKSDYEQLHYLFNTSEKQKQETDRDENEAVELPTAPLSNFSDTQLSLIAKTVNEAHLFVHDVSEAVLRQFFSCSLDRPLHVRNNGLIALFLDALRSECLISHSWQKKIEDNQLLCSFRQQKPLKRTDLSTSLSEYKSHHPQTMKEFASIANKLKNM